MKAISLWQPHATLFAIGARCIETRGEWAMRIKYRGPLLIHAAKKWDKDRAVEYSNAGFILRENKFGVDRPMSEVQQQIYATPVKDMLGCLLAIGELYDIKPIPDIQTAGFENFFDRFFGCFGPGRVGLFLRNVKPIWPPIKLTGRQGLFDVPDELVKEYV